MAVEVEVKIKHLSNSFLEAGKLIKEKLIDNKAFDLLRAPQMVTTEDIYYVKQIDDAQDTVRFRVQHTANIETGQIEDSYLLTTKVKSIHDNVEVNAEHEKILTKEDYKNKLNCYRSQGYNTIGFVKIKTGMRHKFTNGVSVTAEEVSFLPLTENTITSSSVIQSLGCFFEIEKVLPEGTAKEEVDAAMRLLRKTVKLLELNTEDIDSRPWKQIWEEILKEKENKSE